MSKNVVNKVQFAGQLPRIEPGVGPEFGESPIPGGMVRFNHYTSDPESAASIQREGLLRSHAEESYARGGTEAPITFATAGTPKEDLLRTRTVVEGWADPSRKSGQLDIGENWRDTDPSEHAAHLEAGHQTITMRGDIPASQIVGVHEPWQRSYRYIASDPSMERGVMAGDYDTHGQRSPDPDTQRALDTAKMAMMAKVMLGAGLQGQSYEDQGLATERNPNPRNRR